MAPRNYKLIGERVPFVIDGKACHGVVTDVCGTSAVHVTDVDGYLLCVKLTELIPEDPFVTFMRKTLKRKRHSST